MRIDINGYLATGSYPYLFAEGDITGSADVVAKIKSTPQNEPIAVYINSPGGSVFAGIAIYSELRARNDVTIYITGLAASAASLVAQAGKCLMSPAAMMMVHKVSTYASGNSDDFEKTAQDLLEMDTAIIGAYREKTHKTDAELMQLLSDETWMSSAKAISLGFADALWETQTSTPATTPPASTPPQSSKPTNNTARYRAINILKLRNEVVNL